MMDPITKETLENVKLDQALLQRIRQTPHWHLCRRRLSSTVVHITYRDRGPVRRLSSRQSAICETATGPRCRCRCRGVLHGTARGPVALPADPHQVLHIQADQVGVQLEMLAPQFVTARKGGNHGRGLPGPGRTRGNLAGPWSSTNGHQDPRT